MREEKFVYESFGKCTAAAGITHLLSLGYVPSVKIVMSGGLKFTTQSPLSIARIAVKTFKLSYV